MQLEEKPKAEQRIILVLDTSVILADDHILDVIGDYDLAIPARVLEELDPFKEGHEFINHAARAFIRKMDDISGTHTLDQWLSLRQYGNGHVKVIISGSYQDHDATEAYEEGRSDNYIINAALTLKEQEDQSMIILLSNDINLRLKAKALGIKAVEYHARSAREDIAAAIRS